MSRRARKRSGVVKRRGLGKLVIAVVLLLLISVGVGYGLLRSYLHSDAFRKFLSTEASKTAGVTGEFGQFKWQGLALESGSFEATGANAITAVRADDLHTEISLGGVLRGVWEVRDTHARRLEVSLDVTKLTQEAAVVPPRPTAPGAATRESKRSTWFPREAELQGIEVGEVAVKATLPQGLMTLSGMRVQAEQAGGKSSYRGEIKGGKIELPFPYLPTVQLDRARLRYQPGQVFLTDASVNLGAAGKLQASGEWDMKSQQFSITGDAYDLKCDEVLKPDWAKLLTGEIATTYTFENPSGIPQACGKLTLKNTTLTALPMLDALAAYADTRRFRILALNTARSDWQWQKGQISLTNLVISCDGLIRLEGSLTVRDRTLDGQFRLGLAPGSLATIPGAETDVFTPGEGNLMWTPLRLTGTLDDPKEDLTDRLITAAGLRMFDQIPATGEKALRFTRSVIEETATPTVEQGVEIIGKGTDALRSATGILGNLLTGEAPPETDKIPAPPAVPTTR